MKFKRTQTILFCMLVKNMSTKNDQFCCDTRSFGDVPGPDVIPHFINIICFVY